MSVDQQILQRPSCQKCGLANAGFVYYSHLLVCGNCVTKIQEIERKRNEKLWLEED